MRNKEYTRKRQLNSKKLRPANYLIVCEGKQTEPNYFEGLKKRINACYGEKIDVVIPNIDVKGTGRNTLALVAYTEKFVNYSNKQYEKVWVVFDKDDYNDEQFNDASRNCCYNVLWSNPNFELWLLLHFRKVTNYITKDAVFDYLNKEFQKNNLGLYRKNDKEIFEKVSNCDRLGVALENAKKMVGKNDNLKPSESNPMTMVYKIVDDLKCYL